MMDLDMLEVDGHKIELDMDDASVVDGDYEEHQVAADGWRIGTVWTERGENWNAQHMVADEEATRHRTMREAVEAIARRHATWIDRTPQWQDELGI